ncbi:hypothetical protein [Methylobacterium sp. J-068]|uniref:hypothetical protein n=1 Tax=Methylobacterium sp. J-068 TaxID=2836649 RepID=UPI001FB8D6EC|nr:hypothetical protein [Methylobacterium sp. J-068]MCJ2033179.1 hypothetical protein [Methylobacterium sp. J-068]
MSFARAYATQAEDLAGALGITDAAAKALMKDEFKAVEKVELYDWGKEPEERFYRPEIEAGAREREAAQAAGTSAESDRARARDVQECVGAAGRARGGDRRRERDAINVQLDKLKRFRFGLNRTIGVHAGLLS